MNQSLRQQLFILLFLIPSSFANARYGNHGGGGWGGGGGGGGSGQQAGMGMGSAGSMMDQTSGATTGGTTSRREMMKLIHKLIDSHDDIQRYYNETDDGVESYTFTDDPEKVEWIQRHVEQMTELMEVYPANGGIRLWDPLFSAAFEFSDFHEILVTNTDDGVRVEQKVVADIDDETKACTISIIREHAKVVSKFVAFGRAEMRKNHDVPKTCKAGDRTRVAVKPSVQETATTSTTSTTATAALVSTANNAANMFSSGIQIMAMTVSAGMFILAADSLF